jgi:hypothetical protein
LGLALSFVVVPLYALAAGQNLTVNTNGLFQGIGNVRFRPEADITNESVPDRRCKPVAGPLFGLPDGRIQIVGTDDGEEPIVRDLRTYNNKNTWPQNHINCQ